MAYRTTIRKENFKEIAKIGKTSFRIQFDKTDLDETYCTVMEETFNYKPEMETIKQVILGYYNAATSREIIEGMEYTTVGGTLLHPYLSNENQMNYKNAFDLEIEPYRIKNQDGYEPAYYVFTTKEEFAVFYRATVQHINDCMEAAWQKKDSVEWDKYVYEEEETEAEIATAGEETSIYGVNYEGVTTDENVGDIQA